MHASEMVPATIAVPAARTATLTGAAIDTLTYVGLLTICQHIGVVSGTNPTWAGKIQDSADGSTDWTDVSGATFTTVTASTNFQYIRLHKRGFRRYFRVVGTIGGTDTPTFNSSYTFFGKKQVAT